MTQITHSEDHTAAQDDLPVVGEFGAYGWAFLFLTAITALVLVLNF